MLGDPSESDVTHFSAGAFTGLGPAKVVQSHSVGHIPVFSSNIFEFFRLQGCQGERSMGKGCPPCPFTPGLAVLAMSAPSRLESLSSREVGPVLQQGNKAQPGLSIQWQGGQWCGPRRLLQKPTLPLRPMASPCWARDWSPSPHQATKSTLRAPGFEVGLGVPQEILGSPAPHCVLAMGGGCPSLECPSPPPIRTAISSLLPSALGTAPMALSGTGGGPGKPSEPVEKSRCVFTINNIFKNSPFPPQI